MKMEKISNVSLLDVSGDKILSNVFKHHPDLFAVIKPLNTKTKPYIKRIIALIGDGVGSVSTIINQINPSLEDSDKITDLIDDLVDNDDLKSVKGISDTFLCKTEFYPIYLDAFEAIGIAVIEFENSEPGFFDNLFSDN